MKIIWDESGKRFYETGVNQGVLYVEENGQYPNGVAWNGLVGVTESPSGAEPKPLYADNIKYANFTTLEELAATVEAYTYPDEFGLCDGSYEIAPGVLIGQQKRKAFGLSYKTVLGNDVDGDDLGYKLHFVYGAKAAPSEKNYQTINDSPDAITFSWELSTTPVPVTGAKPTASLVIESTKVDPAKLAALEAIVYGTEGAAPRLPFPDEIAAIFVSDAPDAVAIVSVVPDDDAVTVAVDSNVVITFNNEVISEAVVVLSELGAVVPGVKTWNTAKKVLTFNPTDDLGAATTYFISIGGVVDVYGQSLASVVYTFTTA